MAINNKPNRTEAAAKEDYGQLHRESKTLDDDFSPKSKEQKENEQEDQQSPSKARILQCSLQKTLEWKGGFGATTIFHQNGTSGDDSSCHKGKQLCKHL